MPSFIVNDDSDDDNDIYNDEIVNDYVDWM